MLYITDSSTNPYWNLAAEEYLLKEHSMPIFRLWRNDNAIIVGCNQNTLAEVDINYVKENGVKVVRRLTGGGAVFHDLGNLNFTFIESKNSMEDSSAMFKRFTAPIIDALNSLGVKAYLEGRNDLLIDGKKFSGNAVCIYKDRVLQHGTLLFSSSMVNLTAALKTRPEKFMGKAVQSNRSRVTNISEHLKLENMPEGGEINISWFKDYLGNYICSKYPDIKKYEYTPEDIARIDELTAKKYSLESWNFGKSPAYSFSKVSKLTGGIVEIYMNVEKGSINKIEIYGDYFFTKPTAEFAEKLIGVQHTYNFIEERLKEIDSLEKSSGNPLGISAYFNGITIEELSSMFFN